MVPCRTGFRMRNFFKLLTELSANDSCDENTSDGDKKIYINDEANFGENPHKIS